MGQCGVLDAKRSWIAQGLIDERPEAPISDQGAFAEESAKV
jgi:hypothetical protein